jgi:hypothetical protein
MRQRFNVTENLKKFCNIMENMSFLACFLVDVGTHGMHGAVFTYARPGRLFVFGVCCKLQLQARRGVQRGCHIYF